MFLLKGKKRAYFQDMCKWNLGPAELTTDLHHTMISPTFLAVQEAGLEYKVLVLLFCVMYQPTIMPVHSALDIQNLTLFMLHKRQQNASLSCCCDGCVAIPEQNKFFVTSIGRLNTGCVQKLHVCWKSAGFHCAIKHYLKKWKTCSNHTSVSGIFSTNQNKFLLCINCLQVKLLYFFREMMHFQEFLTFTYLNIFVISQQKKSAHKCVYMYV